MKRKKLRTRSKSATSMSKGDAWDWCSRYVRLLNRISGTDTAQCVTCGNIYSIHGKGCIQAGHAFGGRGNAILYDTRIIYPQCPICNRWHRGEYVKFELFLRTKLPLDVIEEIKRASVRTVHMTPSQHAEIGEMFKRKCEELGGWPW